MKKRSKRGTVIGIVLAIPFMLLLIARFTGALATYTSPTTTNAPTLSLDELFAVSNLPAPTHMDFVVYKAEDSLRGAERRVHRLVAMEGDKLQISDGVLYVNGKNADESLDLYQEYKIATADLYLRGLTPDSLGIEDYAQDEDSVALISDHRKMKSYVLPNRRIIMYQTEGSNNLIARNWGQATWNVDQFGPIVVPKDSIFLMGDNRHGSMDSRFIGFVARQAVIGVVVWH